MASSSNNSSLASAISHRRDYYDVFVTFRGEDTRYNFIAFLLDALEKKGIFVFRDDINLQIGDSVGSELIQAIERSQIFIAVLSRNYASSTQCLQELEKICECVQGTQKLVFPIFYDVGPSEVLKQSGIYADAFDQHEQRFRQDSQMVSRWRTALKQVANITGWDLRNR